MHHFDSPLGSEPRAPFLQVAGTLYGTTALGGANGQGTVFKMDADGGNFAVLHDFNTTDGSEPEAGLILASNGREAPHRINHLSPVNSPPAGSQAIFFMEGGGKLPKGLGPLFESCEKLEPVVIRREFFFGENAPDFEMLRIQGAAMQQTLKESATEIPEDTEKY